MQSDLHCIGYERASQLSKNMFFNHNMQAYNPYFNKSEIQYPMTDYAFVDLFYMNQLPLSNLVKLLLGDNQDGVNAKGDAEIDHSLLNKLLDDEYQKQKIDAPKSQVI